MCGSYLERKKLLLFNDLKFGECCNGYRHAIFTTLFYKSQVEYLRKAFTKDKKKFLSLFYYFLLYLYDLNYLYTTKILLSNQKSGMVWYVCYFKVGRAKSNGEQKIKV